MSINFCGVWFDLTNSKEKLTTRGDLECFGAPFSSHYGQSSSAMQEPRSSFLLAARLSRRPPVKAGLSSRRQPGPRYFTLLHFPVNVVKMNNTFWMVGGRPAAESSRCHVFIVPYFWGSSGRSGWQIVLVLSLAPVSYSAKTTFRTSLLKHIRHILQCIWSDCKAAELVRAVEDLAGQLSKCTAAQHHMFSN